MNIMNMINECKNEYDFNKHEYNEYNEYNKNKHEHQYEQEYNKYNEQN